MAEMIDAGTEEGTARLDDLEAIGASIQVVLFGVGGADIGGVILANLGGDFEIGTEEG